MTKDKAKKLHLVYGFITALLILAVGIALIVNCVNIYRSGDRPFSRVAIASVCRQLSIPGWVCLVTVLGGFVMRHALPLDDDKTKPIRCDALLLRRYESKFSELSKDGQKKIQEEIARMKLTRWICGILLLCLCIYPVVYFADAAHFGVTDINADILKATIVVLIPSFAGFAILYVSGRMLHGCILRQIEVYKTDAVKPEKVSHEEPSKKVVRTLRYAILAIAIVLIVMGIANDGVADVLGKAIRICTECIGLG